MWVVVHISLLWCISGIISRALSQDPVANLPQGRVVGVSISILLLNTPESASKSFRL